MSEESGPTIVLPTSARVALSTDQVHRLVVPALQVVALRLLTFEHDPIAATDCTLGIGGRKLRAQTDDDGLVSFKVIMAGDVAEAQLVLDTAVHGWASGRSLLVSELPDVSSPEGQRVRLDTLGYVPVVHDEPEDADTPSRWAIEAFQCEHELLVDGNCGPTTQAKLVEVHGH